MKNIGNLTLILSVFLALIVGTTFGWLTHSWLSPTIPTVETLPVSSSPLLASRTLDERIAFAETELKESKSKYDVLLRESGELSRSNAALNEARMKAEKARVHVDQNTEFMSKLASKLADEGELLVPETVADAAVLSGQLNRNATDFYTKWGGTPPAAGTPDAASYQQEMNTLTADMAAVMKSIGENGIDNDSGTAASVAQFQSLQIYGALQLSDTQWQQINNTLTRYYSDAFSRGLNNSLRPNTGVEGWQQQRTVLSQQAFNDIQAILPQRQRDDFLRLYKPEFFWKITVGMQ